MIAAMARCIKFLLNTCRVPIILVGEGPLAEIASYDALRRRTAGLIDIGAYNWSSKDEHIEFLDCLDQLDEALDFPELSGLAENEDLAARLYLASRGQIGLVVKYLSAALKSALLAGKNKITLDHLAEGYLEFAKEKRKVANSPAKIRPTRATSKNPFKLPKKGFDALWAEVFSEESQDDSRIMLRQRRKKEPVNAFASAR